MYKGHYENHRFLMNDVMPFCFNNCGNPKGSYGNWHSSVELALVYNGEGSIKYGGDDIPLKKGDIVVVNSGEVHLFNRAENFAFYNIIIGDVFFTQNGIDLSELLFKRVINDQVTRELFLKLFEDVIRCKMMRKNLSQNTTIPEPFICARLRSGLLNLLVDLCTRHTVDKDEKSDNSRKTGERYTKMIMKYIDNNFSESITLDDLANHAGITKYHLAREFKNYTGQTIFHHINVVRCKYAEHLISNGVSVTDAAIQSGFLDLAYFSRVYKKIKGKSPSEFKKQNPKKHRE